MAVGSNLGNVNYIDLYYSGELSKRADVLGKRLSSCDICPRKCKVNRVKGEIGFCHSAFYPIVASFCDHHGEEPALSGTNGSGTIFFGNCNLRCCYCQNYQISQNWTNQSANEMDFLELARKMVYLQDELGCHNINFVSPTHFVPQILRAVNEAIPLGLHIPLVYNTNAYDSLETICMLDGIIDIYLPDIKYSSNKLAYRYSEAPDYVQISRQAIKEMYRQVGDLILNDKGVAIRGLIIRHLILPQNIAGSRKSLEWLARNLSTKVALSIMSQYWPSHKARSIPELARKISRNEYNSVVQILEQLGFENGWLQQLDSADYYLPDFESNEHPFH